MSFKFIPQHDKMDCGPSCLAMVSNYFGKNYSLQFFRENSFITREGVSLLGISEAANKVGLKTISTKLGNLECYIVQATAKSRIGETELISYFNPKFGFVKLEYKNIDGTKTVLELENVE